MSTPPLFAPAPGGGWYLPTVQAPPGIFVEPGDAECIPDLTEEELHGPVRAAAERCLWTSLGFEAGRTFDRISIRCDVRDYRDLMWPCWFLASDFPGEDRDGFRAWAVEFPEGSGPRFVRRRLWARAPYPPRLRGAA